MNETMKKYLVIIALAIALTGCHRRLVTIAPPPPIETKPVNKWVLTGILDKVVYFPAWDDDIRHNEELSIVYLMLQDGKVVVIAFPGKILVDEFRKGEMVKITFTGSYSRASLVSIE